MRIWKFIIPVDEPREDAAGDVWLGMGAAVVAADEAGAREALRAHGRALADGRVGWLEVADVTSVGIEPGAVALWVEI